MAALEILQRRVRAWIACRRRALVSLVAVVAWVGCSSSPSPDPEPLPPQTATRHQPEAPAATPSPTPPPPVTPAPTTIVIEPPRAEPAENTSLVEAARKERERRAGAAAPAVKLDNKNLQAFGADQKLTVATPGERAPGEPGETDEVAPAAATSAAEEEHWRTGARAIRERWAFAVQDVERLEAESADLRRQFYAEDDPYVRDQQIKPEWDRVLGELDRARRDAAKAPRDLEAFIEEGRRAGALPGWLREGIELEPEPPAEEASPLGPAEPREPVVVEKDPENP